MLIRRPDDIPSSSITPESVYLNRREFFGQAGALALGTMAALQRRAIEGGSWLVRASLAATGHWIRSQGLVSPPDYAGLGRDLPPEQIAKLVMDSPSPIAKLTHLAPAAQLSVTPGRWDRPAVPLGTHEPRWPDRTGA